MCRRLTIIGVALLALATLPEVASATAGAAQPVPYYETLFLVGLAMLCPEDINDVVNSWLRRSDPT